MRRKDEFCALNSVGIGVNGERKYTEKYNKWLNKFIF